MDRLKLDRTRILRLLLPVELTRFGGHLNTWDHKSRMKEVNRADEVHQALSIGVPD